MSVDKWSDIQVCGGLKKIFAGVRRAEPMFAARARHGGGRCGHGRGVRGRLARLAAARLRSRALPRVELPIRRGTPRVSRRVSWLPVPSGSGQVRPTLLSRYTDFTPWPRYSHDPPTLTSEHFIILSHQVVNVVYSNHLLFFCFARIANFAFFVAYI